VPPTASELSTYTMRIASAFHFKSLE